VKFLADMGISLSTINWLKARDYDSVHLRDKGLQRISDTEIVKIAKKENRIILTCDLDFCDIIAASQDIYPSVIIFRLDNEKPENVNRRLAQILKESYNALQKGAIISVEESRHRVRLLPI